MSIDEIVALCSLVPVSKVIAVLAERPRAWRYLTLQSALMTTSYLNLRAFGSQAIARRVGAVAVPVAALVMLSFWPLRVRLNWNNCAMWATMTKIRQPNCKPRVVTAGQVVLHLFLPLAALWSAARQKHVSLPRVWRLVAPVYILSLATALYYTTDDVIYPNVAPLKRWPRYSFVLVTAGAAIVLHFFAKTYTQL